MVASKRISKAPREVYPEVASITRPSSLIRLQRKRRSKRESSRRQNRIDQSSMLKIQKTSRICNKSALMHELCKSVNPPFILSKSFIPGAGFGVVCNWKFSHNWKSFLLPFLEMEYVEFYPWDVADWVIGEVSTKLLDPTNNYAAYRLYLKKNRNNPKKVWRPMKLYTRDDSSKLLVACAQFVNHILPSKTPDNIAIVPSTGQDLRVANCKLVFSHSNSPYLKEHKTVRLRPGWELLFNYADGFMHSYNVLNEQEKDHQAHSSQLASHFSQKTVDVHSPTPRVSNDVLTKVRVQQEAFDLKQLADANRLLGVRDCPAELACNPLVSVAVEPVIAKVAKTPVIRNRPYTPVGEEYAWSCFRANLAQLPRCRGPKGLASVQARCRKYLDRCPVLRVDDPREPCSPGDAELTTEEDLATWHMSSLPPEERPQPLPEYRKLPVEDDDSEPDPYRNDSTKRSSHR